MSTPSRESSKEHVQEFHDKLEEIRAVFVLGRRSFPFLEDTIQFVQDITVLLEEVNATIQTRSGHMGKATDQLRSVSEATEVATDEILDYTDQVLSELSVLEAGMEASQKQFEDVAAADQQLLELLREELEEERPELLKKVEEIESVKRRLRDDWSDRVGESQEALSNIRSIMNQITMSLQVQDITEQQLSSVNHLIETVQARIAALMEDLGSGKVAEKDIPSGKPSSTATFNANARYDHSPERQRTADETVQNMGDGSAGPHTGSDASASPSDIDEMFGDGGASGADEDTSDQGGGEMASQEDIDEFFQ
jgi:DNA repair exonuclease SbcCD ATPase subunit